MAKHCCQILRINGIVTHEHGCTEAWRNTLRECRWCGSGFKPATRTDQFCEDSCYRSWHGFMDPEEDSDAV